MYINIYSRTPLDHSLAGLRQGEKPAVAPYFLSKFLKRSITAESKNWTENSIDADDLLFTLISVVYRTQTLVY